MIVPDLIKFDPNDPLKVFVQIGTLISISFAVGSILTSRTFPWLKALRESRRVGKNLDPYYSSADTSRSIRYYIEPFCQDVDPAGAEEPRFVYGVRQKLFEALDDALLRETEFKYIILLADSGMGKTSAFINYYARHLRRWRHQNQIALIPLYRSDADDRIAAIENKSETILLLDALDEDTQAIVDHAGRIRLLLKATSDFHRIILSSRTQFFPKEEEIPVRTGLFKLGPTKAGETAEYYFHKIYLSPFSNRQIVKYIRRLYPLWRLRRRRSAHRLVEKIPNLVVRPMLLAYIDDLVKSNRVIHYSFELYEEMISGWIEREKKFVENGSALREFSERLAVDLIANRQARGAEVIPYQDLKPLAEQWRIDLDQWKLSGRSLLNRDSAGMFKFAHRSIMEYLFVVRVASDSSALRFPASVKWSDQMMTFLLESLSATNASSESTLLFLRNDTRLLAKLIRFSLEVPRAVVPLPLLVEIVRLSLDSGSAQFGIALFEPNSFSAQYAASTPAEFRNAINAVMMRVLTKLKHEGVILDNRKRKAVNQWINYDIVMSRFNSKLVEVNDRWMIAASPERIPRPVLEFMRHLGREIPDEQSSEG